MEGTPRSGRACRLPSGRAGRLARPVIPHSAVNSVAACSATRTVRFSGDTHPPPLATPQRPAFLLRQAAPDARVLSGVQRPLQAFLTDWAERTDGLGRLHLGLGGPSGADREEQLRVHVTAAGTMARIH